MNCQKMDLDQIGEMSDSEQCSNQLLLDPISLLVNY